MSVSIWGLCWMSTSQWATKTGRIHSMPMTGPTTRCEQHPCITFTCTTHWRPFQWHHNEYLDVRSSIPSFSTSIQHPCQLVRHYDDMVCAPEEMKNCTTTLPYQHYDDMYLTSSRKNHDRYPSCKRRCAKR